MTTPGVDYELVLELEAQLPSSLDMTTISQTVDCFQDASRASYGGVPFNLVIDMANVRFVTPTGLATLTAIMAMFARSGYLRSGRILPTTDDDLQTYLERMDFYDYFQIDTGMLRNRYHPEGRFCELHEVNSEAMCQESASSLLDVIGGNLRLSSEATNSIDITLTELMENVFHHANSPVNAIVHAQAYQAAQQVELAIVDCGIGFKRSLSMNPKLVSGFSNSAEAIQLAVGPRTTGRPSHNSGEGLFFTKRFVEENGGKMLIYSDDGQMLIQRKKVKYQTNAPRWLGSIVALRLQLSGPVSISKVYNQHAATAEPFEDLVFDTDEDELPF
jgi:anti-sigma regulatory factor (Ser/Thr protein kinase)